MHTSKWSTWMKQKAPHLLDWPVAPGKRFLHKSSVVVTVTHTCFASSTDLSDLKQFLDCWEAEYHYIWYRHTGWSKESEIFEWNLRQAACGPAAEPKSIIYIFLRITLIELFVIVLHCHVSPQLPDVSRSRKKGNVWRRRSDWANKYFSRTRNLRRLRWWTIELPGHASDENLWGFLLSFLKKRQ